MSDKVKGWLWFGAAVFLLLIIAFNSWKYWQKQDRELDLMVNNPVVDSLKQENARLKFEKAVDSAAVVKFERAVDSAKTELTKIQPRSVQWRKEYNAKTRTEKEAITYQNIDRIRKEMEGLNH